MMQYFREHRFYCWISSEPILRIRLPMQETQETWIWSLGREDPLEKERVTHSRILAWEILWTEEPGGLQSMGSQRVRHDWTCTHNNSSQPILRFWANLTYWAKNHSMFGSGKLLYVSAWWDLSVSWFGAFGSQSRGMASELGEEQSLCASAPFYEGNCLAVSHVAHVFLKASGWRGWKWPGLFVIRCLIPQSLIPRPNIRKPINAMQPSHISHYSIFFN